MLTFLLAVKFAVNDRVVSGSREQGPVPSLGVTLGSKTLAVKIHLQELAISYSINLGGNLELHFTIYNQRTLIVLKIICSSSNDF